MAQNISQRMGFAGSITNLDVSLPEQTDKPFHYAYDYNRKEYADWANRRILPLMFPVSLTNCPRTRCRRSRSSWGRRVWRRTIR